MYADHKSCDHDAWQARIDANCNAWTNEKTSDGTLIPADAPTQKLALNMISFEMFFAHRLIFLLKQLIEFGKMLRETSRSKSWGE
jgi:hypothetical protein